MRYFLRVCLSTLFFTALISAAVGVHVTTPSQSGVRTTGSAISVIDGDTIQIDGAVVDLDGIDAPELGQRCYHDGVLGHCGLAAAFELNKIIGIGRDHLRCSPAREVTREQSKVCTVDHADVAYTLLKAGYAVATVDANPGYLEAEDAARRAQLGLWHSEFVQPVAWRAGRRLPVEGGSDAEACPIKAITAENGARLYYVPTDEAYASVKVDRVFCSDEEARHAGWRREGEAAGG